MAQRAVSKADGDDRLNRPTTGTVAATSVPSLARSVSLTYNAIGNLLDKSAGFRS